MNGYLAPTSLLLAAPWRWRLNQTPARLLWGGVLGLGSLLGLLAWTKGWPTALFATGLAGAVLLVVGWMLTLSGLRRQNHPHLARLVPGHVQRLRLAVLLLWGLPVLAAGALAAWLRVDVWTTVLLAALGLSLLTALVRWPLSIVLVAFAPPALVPLLQGSALAQGLVRAWVAVWQAGPAWLCLPLLAGLALFQMDLMGKGDAAHVRRYEQMLRLLASMQDGAGGFNPRHQGRWGLRMMWLFSMLNRWYMARLIRHSRPTLRHVLARLELPLYGSAHWTLVVGSMMVVLPLIALGAALLLLLVPDMIPPGRSLGQIAWTWPLMALGQLCMGMMMGTLFSLGTALQRSRREQALLVLLPGLPQQPGRLRARLLARQAWLMLGLAVPGLLLLSQAALPPPGSFLQGLGVGALLASLLLLRRWDTRTSAGSTGLLVVAVLAALAWQLLLPEHWGLLERGSLSGLILFLVAGAWMLALRRLQGEPLQALPWGRNASRPQA
ncbi:hypothetical protein H5407_00350 [Mitsuaria sp. WAJ17]|uniref:hypothetical protein n=1 Tax=Mitsuaria sp. WAJ17 TaxID=2761452 RepID=UPI00160409D4|nr:hypothetical protein [Mitsuaria sp. WAJ17]MBB2483668.1 hypothetical protein [Mitsuaria sp. WAJ17]